MQDIVEDDLEVREYLMQDSVLSCDGRVWLSVVCAEDFVHVDRRRPRRRKDAPVRRRVN
jgi:hypothetical protein